MAWSGGSLALGKLLDEYGEELYLDLKQYWGFDLASFLGGEVFSSFKLIFSMIRGLPEGSRYVAVRAGDVDQMKQDIKITTSEQRQLDSRTWSFDRQLTAMAVNAININTVLTGGPWKDNKPPEFAVVGPTSWDPKRTHQMKQREKYESGNWDLWDVARALGIKEAMVVHTNTE